MLFLFSLLLFVPPDQALDELVLGEWNVQATTFSIDNPAHDWVDYYSAFINETSEARTFDGDIFLTNKTHKLEKLQAIQFIFDKNNNTKISVFLDNDLIANLTIKTSKNGLKTSTGNLTLDNYSYSLTLLSYKATELTIYNHQNKAVTICRLQRTVDEYKTGSTRSFSSVFTVILVMAYIAFGTKNDDAPAQNQSQDENEENGNNGDENENGKESQDDENEHEKAE